MADHTRIWRTEAAQMGAPVPSILLGCMALRLAYYSHTGSPNDLRYRGMAGEKASVYLALVWRGCALGGDVPYRYTLSAAQHSTTNRDRCGVSGVFVSDAYWAQLGMVELV